MIMGYSIFKRSNRDVKMAEGMKSYLNNGDAFVAVGAGHLKGVTDKLQTEGYTIEAIPSGETILFY